jgi:hypothetical protein
MNKNSRDEREFFIIMQVPLASVASTPAQRPACTVPQAHVSTAKVWKGVGGLCDLCENHPNIETSA